MSTPPLIVCDSRERASRVPGLLERAGASVSVERLATGDYLLSAAFALERKTSTDLVDSLLDGRLMVQLEALSNKYEFAALLIEGDAWEGDRRLRSPMLAHLYHWMSLRPYLSVVYSPSPEYSARLLLRLAQMEQARRAPTPEVPRYTPPAARRPEDVLLALPGVGPSGAQRLLRRFGSLRAVLSAPEEELVATIGPKRGRALFEVLDGPNA